MSEFTPITTQEEFDKAVQARVLREQETLSKKYGDYEELKTRNAALEEQVTALNTAIEESKTGTANFETQIADLNKKVAGYETAGLRTRIALQNGIPYEFADMVTGDDEESIKASAQRLAGFGKQQVPPPPLGSKEPALGDNENQGWLEMAKNLGKGE